jgi:hypothetical protein
MEDNIVITDHFNLKNYLDNLQEPIEIKERFDLKAFVHWNGNKDEPIHRWLRYREAYSPDLIDKLGIGDKILDPFCGCGSILVGAAQRGKYSVGIDINPLSTFSTKVKLTKLTKKELKQIKDICTNLEQLISESNEATLPELSIAHKVFEPEILKVVLKSKTLIKDQKHRSERIYNFLHLAWLESLEQIGSYYKEGNGIKYRNKIRSKGKYESRIEGEWQLKRFGVDQSSFAISKIKNQLEIMLDDVKVWEVGSWSNQTVITGSAMNLSELEVGDDFDSIIFSPPYANRFDYFEAFKVELWFGDFVESYDELNKLRKKSLRSHLAAEYRSTNPKFPELEDLIEQMDQNTSSWKMGVPDLLRGYFQDIQTVLTQCKKLSKNGKTHVVVGNSAFAGIIIPTDVLTAIIGLRSGFTSVEILETRHLTVSPQQRSLLKGYEEYMRESVVVFQ